VQHLMYIIISSLHMFGLDIGCAVKLVDLYQVLIFPDFSPLNPVKC
jgi:hypothetical protein